MDDTERNGVNLLKQLDSQEGKKAEIVELSRNSFGKGLKLDMDPSIKPSTMVFEGKKYEGYYVDLKFSNATITSRNLPIQKDDNGFIFIISKMLSRR
jgi:hypothetical protein